jgi:hypothetical protein
VEHTIVFRRSGTRLHPLVMMVELCLECSAQLDQKKLTRGDYAPRGRAE